jgi:hypothetical protein
VATIYKTYVYKGLDIPYFRAISTIVFSLFLHVIQIGVLFEFPSKYIFPFNSSNKTIQWFQYFFYFFALIGICTLIFPRKKLEQQVISDIAISKAKKFIPLYFLGTILLLIGLLIIHGIRKGTLHI